MRKVKTLITAENTKIIHEWLNFNLKERGKPEYDMRTTHINYYIHYPSTSVRNLEFDNGNHFMNKEWNKEYDEIEWDEFLVTVMKSANKNDKELYEIY